MIVPHPILHFVPISQSPIYDKCGTLDPSAIIAFLISTKLPTFTLSANLQPSRIYAFGPMLQSSPITTPDLIVVFGWITVSIPISTSSYIYVVFISSIVTPLFMCIVLIFILKILVSISNWSFVLRLKISVLSSTKTPPIFFPDATNIFIVSVK